MTRWGIGAIGLGWLIVASADRPAAAQDAVPLPTHSSAYRQVDKFCNAELLRFCPPIDQTTALARDQAMCLKLYRADLSLACRNAVAAATAPGRLSP